MSSNYTSFIYFTPKTRGESGRATYIDPELLLPFSDHVNPNTDAGRTIAIAMTNALCSACDGLTAGANKVKPNRYYKDFTQPNGHGIRLYYDIFQDNAGGLNRGPGVYIYDLKLLNKRGKGDTPGLNKIKYDQSNARWDPEKRINNVLDTKKFMIGATQIDGEYSIDETTDTITPTLGNEKDDYNLYYCPEYILDKDAVWEPPEMRIGHTASPEELAEALIQSEDPWVQGNCDSYKTQAFTEGAKTLLKALNIVSKRGKKLKKHTFFFHAPSASIAQLRTAVEQCGASLGDKWFTIGTSAISQLHQENDAVSNVQHLGNTPEAKNTLKIQQKRQQLLANNNATFLELLKAKV
ncbi:MAG: hypothetical protein ACI93R_001160 [Flavobacteriales bacterium]|jgi:hypothetical protein